MRVAIYVPDDEFSPHSGGAIATWTYQVYSRLDRVTSHVICRPTTNSYEKPPHTNLPNYLATNRVLQFLRNRSIKGLLTPVKAYLSTMPHKTAGKLIRETRPEIIHVHNRPESVLAIKESNPRTPIILHMNNDHLIDLPPKDAIKVVQACHSIVFCSSYLKSNAEFHIPEIQNVSTNVIFNGCNIPSQTPTAPTPQQEPKGPIILFAGRLVPYKGVHCLLTAFAELIPEFPDARLRIIGGRSFGDSTPDQYINSLKSLASQFGKSIEFLGPLPQHDIQGEMRKADALVCPSLWNEPFGMVNVEAMGVGTPVIAFAVGGIPEAIGDAGILIEKMTPSDLAEGIRKVIRNPELRQELGRRSKERAQSLFNWETIAHRWHEALMHCKNSTL